MESMPQISEHAIYCCLVAMYRQITHSWTERLASYCLAMQIRKRCSPKACNRILLLTLALKMGFSTKYHGISK